MDVADLTVDPYALWAAARRDEPVTRLTTWGGGNTWLVTRYADVERVLRDGVTFSSRTNADTIGPVMGPMLVAMDGEEHRRYRDLVAYAFRASALARWERDLIAPTIDGLLDEIAPAGRADLVTAVTSRYPVLVITGILGVPVDDARRFHEWAADITLGSIDLARSMAAAAAMRDYLEPIVAARRAAPGDDLVSALVTAEVAGADGTAHRLDDDHLYGFLRLLLPAGAETTFRVFGSCLAALLTVDGLLERVRADRSLVARLVEETLRWETSVTIVSRETTRPVELGGVELPAGAVLMVSTASANHDEARVDEPGRFDIDRAPQPHLAFGTGHHQCLGMHLARLELRVGVEAVLDRLARLRIDPGAPAPRIEGFPFRGPSHLAVLFDPVAS